jgi:hypothetical protein
MKMKMSGPKIGPTGSSIGQKKEIGTGGAIKGSHSTSGGQHPFMPTPKSMQGSASTKSGTSSSPRSDNFYDFMPKKAGGSK